MSKKLFVDSYVTRLAIEKKGSAAVKAELQRLLDEGNTLVATEASSIDNAVFRKNVDWFSRNLAHGNIVVEVFHGNPGDTASGIRQMVNKPFEWSSYDGVKTNWDGDFESLAKTMPDQQRLLKLYRVVLKYAKPKGDWSMGPWKTADYFSDEMLAELGLEKTEAGNRSKVFEAMKAAEYPTEEYVAYTREYVGGLVSQHNCSDIALINMI